MKLLEFRRVQQLLAHHDELRGLIQELSRELLLRPLGLFGEFAHSVYLVALGEPRGDGYVVGQEAPDVHLLLVLEEAGRNAVKWRLAWAPPTELERVQAAHRELMERFRSAPLTAEILRLANDSAEVTREVSERLMVLKAKRLLPGRCAQCDPLVAALA